MAKDRVPLVREVGLKTAKELFSALSPGGKYEEFRDKESDHIVFRGHTNAEFRLIPSALRTKTGGHELHKLAGNWPNDDSEKDSNVLQLLRELSVLQHFFQASDRIGLPLPEDSQELRWKLEHAFFSIVR